ncbi:MAG TPA: hypothetical protein VMC86_11295 [Gemmatimonadales bacterium]|nr:hypothetical protein [Gemmatimonadales bacterium]
MIRRRLAAIGLAAALVTRGVAAQAPKPGVTLDRKHHRVVVVAGPFDLEPMPPMEGMSMDAMMPDTLAQAFAWPVAGWFRGFESEVIDGQGNPLPRELLHHFTLINLDRRTLFDPVAERLAAAGLTPAAAIAPPSVGAPLSPGQRLALYIMWHNGGTTAQHGVYLRITLLWAPSNEQPRPLSTFPVNLDVNAHYGESNTYDVPPGRHAKSATITFPLSGWLLAAGGHLHDYGESVVLEDGRTGKILVQTRAVVGDSGEIKEIPFHILAVLDRGLRIKAGYPYRLVATYNNTSRDTLRDVMGEMMGLFVPDHPEAWPAVNYSDSLYLADLKGYHAVALLQRTPTAVTY